jgi:hypothetical protein
VEKVKGKGKGRRHPSKSHESSDGEKYRYTLLSTSALDGGMGVQRHDPAAFPTGKTRYHCIGGRVGHRAGLEKCGKSRPHREIR